MRSAVMRTLTNGQGPDEEINPRPFDGAAHDLIGPEDGSKAMGRELTSSEIDLISKKAAEYPGVSAGLCRLGDLKASRSYDIYTPSSFRPAGAFTHPVVRPDWPGLDTILVLVMVHPPEHPELDWWDGRETEGNRTLRRIAIELKDWLDDQFGIHARSLPYHPENGGIFLKEAAVLAGLGVIGRNNLFIMPAWGANVRLRAIAVAAGLTDQPPWPVWEPCRDCSALCLEVCPCGAFQDGVYTRERCMNQMTADRKEGLTSDGEVEAIQIRYCRQCELACPIGRSYSILE